MFKTTTKKLLIFTFSLLPLAVNAQSLEEIQAQQAKKLAENREAEKVNPTFNRESDRAPTESETLREDFADILLILSQLNQIVESVDTLDSTGDVAQILFDRSKPNVQRITELLQANATARQDAIAKQEASLEEEREIQRAAIASGAFSGAPVDTAPAAVTTPIAANEPPKELSVVVVREYRNGDPAKVSILEGADGENIAVVGRVGSLMRGPLNGIVYKLHAVERVNTSASGRASYKVTLLDPSTQKKEILYRG